MATQSTIIYKNCKLWCFWWFLPGEGQSLCLQVFAQTFLHLLQHYVALFQLVQKTGVRAQLNDLKAQTHQYSFAVALPIVGSKPALCVLAAMTNLSFVEGAFHDPPPGVLHLLVPFTLHWQLLHYVVRAEDGLQVEPG